MDFKAISALSETDMDSVNQLIQQQLSSDVALINQLGFYIINSGGKRMRPLLTVLAARALGYEGKDHISIAAIIEFIHTSTLLHDDVVDESTMRRGKETANALFGNQASVLVGDFLYSRSFQMMTDINNLTVMKVLADATNIIAEGEVLQLINVNDPDTTEESYMRVIYCKTAKLFEAATHLAAVINGNDQNTIEAMKLYGMHLGTAFQLVDDHLDYTADAEKLGKNIGDDLAEGKPTLPLIYAMAHGSTEQAEMIRDAIVNGNGLAQLKPILAALDETGALDYTLAQAQVEADKAISALAAIPDSPSKQALVSLAHIAANRNT
ncbi:octaprenyl diphosphate synthase [Psychrobium sp. 1_MG-2023]|uniref:octaprenyl diphosphate synthase n=1 Tax=Psychrobium sp. 1_MG-2023 TaxID=3062624 RepID=UPI000C32AA66|nr:octaprenyl diphosphate synthase [Psychrobium sp. 1_MG-2023]MDP2560857.1 octaprenyl diphosphate synthase [Psychrobium sp. 1_MG-2023]PKF56731.1 octaprenyl diphosphate synthase [Alteromonadales bacterium alter-6D02]